MLVSFLLTSIIAGSSPRISDEDAGPLTQSSVDELLAVVLDRALTVKDYLPDGGFLPTDGPLLVRREIRGSSAVVSSKALKDPNRWLIRSEQALQEQADMTRKRVFFVMVNDIEIAGNFATLEVGVDMTFRAPDDPKRVILKMCCCWGTDHYQRNDLGTWQFQKRDKVGCN
jgi:hypothetical protein